MRFRGCNPKAPPLLGTTKPIPGRCGAVLIGGHPPKPTLSILGSCVGWGSASHRGCEVGCPQEALGSFWGALTPPPFSPLVPRACLRKAVEVASLLAGKRCSVVLQGRGGGQWGGDSGMEGTPG